MKHQGRVHPAPAGLIEKGPLISVTLAPPPVAASLMQAPLTAPIVARLMIDTGAELTVIENAIAERLGLPPIRFIPIVGVSQVSEECPVYRVSMTLGVEDGAETAEIQIQTDVVGVASPTMETDHVGLVGRDVLAHFHFAYNGPEGAFDLIVPEAMKRVLNLSKPKSRAQRRAEERAALKKGAR